MVLRDARDDPPVHTHGVCEEISQLILLLGGHVVCAAGEGQMRQDTASARLGALAFLIQKTVHSSLAHVGIGHSQVCVLLARASRRGGEIAFLVRCLP